MIRLIGGAAASAVLLLGGTVACSGLSGSAAAGPAAPAHSPAGAETGVISGRFVILGTMGQPGSASDHPARGTVVFTDGRHRLRTTRASRSGTFSVHLPPGIYHVYGRSPQLTTVSENGTSQEDKVTLAHQVTVTAGHTTKIVLRAIVP